MTRNQLHHRKRPRRPVGSTGGEFGQVNAPARRHTTAGGWHRQGEDGGSAHGAPVAGADRPAPLPLDVGEARDLASRLVGGIVTI